MEKVTEDDYGIEYDYKNFQKHYDMLLNCVHITIPFLQKYLREHKMKKAEKLYFEFQEDESMIFSSNKTAQSENPPFFFGCTTLFIKTCDSLPDDLKSAYKKGQISIQHLPSKHVKYSFNIYLFFSYSKKGVVVRIDADLQNNHFIVKNGPDDIEKHMTKINMDDAQKMLMLLNALESN